MNILKPIKTTIRFIKRLQRYSIKSYIPKEFQYKDIFSKRIVKIGTPADYPPFSYVNNNNEYSGFDIDLIKEIFSDLQTKYEIIKTSWANLNNDLSSGKFDMAIGGISLTNTRKQFLFSLPIMQDGKTILTTKKYENQVKTLADIDKCSFTVVENRGGTNEEFAREHIKNAKIVVLENNLEIFDKLAAGEFDFMFTDLSEALHRESLDNRLAIAKPINIYTNPVGYGFIYNQHNTILHDYIDEYLKQLIGSTQFKEISNKYFNIGQNI